jgi:hypothetical protein
VLVVLQRIPRATREHDGVQPDVELLHPDVAEVESVPEHDDREADEHAGEGQPRERAAGRLADAVERVGERTVTLRVAPARHGRQSLRICHTAPGIRRPRGRTFFWNAE